MKRRRTILLMLGLIGCQGGGLLRALHVSIGHGYSRRDAPETVACACGRQHASEHAGASWCSSGSRGHQHHSSTCPVCQTLASLQFLTGLASAGPVSGMPPLRQAAAPQSIRRSCDRLFDLVPRAPPAARPHISA